MFDLSALPRKALAAAANETHRDPTDAQKAAGNYKKGKVRLHGLDISIENPKGSTRSGTGGDGKKWSVKLPDHYGYIKRTEGADGDHVDVYIGPHPASREVFVVDQIDERTKRFDEHKAMLGYDSEEAALAAYHKAFSDGKAKDRIGGVARMSIDEFKLWLRAGDTSKPIGKQMPLLKGKKNIGANIHEMQSHGHSYEQSVAAALKAAYGPKRANGGHVGPLHGTSTGRADDIATTVADGSHILTADCVSAIGDGNTEAGYAKLLKMFPHSHPYKRAEGGGIAMPHMTSLPGTPHISSTPHLVGLPKPHMTTPHLAGVPQVKGIASLPHMTKPKLAKGGEAKQVPVKLSAGEFCVSPEDVARIGKGDLERGHAILDKLILEVRKANISKLKKLPGPVGSKAK